LATQTIQKLIVNVGSGYILLDSDREPSTSLNATIHQALTTAFILKAPIELEFWKAVVSLDAFLPLI
jgi:hypothetical protein